MRSVEEIVTLAMLLNDSPPRVCNACHGEGLIRKHPWGRELICTRCGGERCDWIGMKTRKAMRKTNGEK